MQIPSFIESVDEPTLNGKTIRDAVGRKYYQTPSAQGSPMRMASNVPGDIMVGDMNEGEMVGFRKDGKFYVPLQVRRGMAEPRKIYALLSRMRVDRIFFNENANYADNVDPQLLDRLCRPYEEYDALRIELRRRLTAEGVFNVPAWLRKPPTIDILEALATIKNRKERVATIAATMMANVDFMETLEYDAPETLVWLREAAGDDEVEARVEDPEVEEDDEDIFEGVAMKEGEGASDDSEDEAPPPGVAAPYDDGEFVQVRLDTIERRLDALLDKLASTPVTALKVDWDGDGEPVAAAEDIFETAAVPEDSEGYFGVRNPIVKGYSLRIGDEELKIDADMVLERSGSRATLSLPRSMDEKLFPTAPEGDGAFHGEGVYDGVKIKEASAALAVGDDPNVIRILTLGD